MSVAGPALRTALQAVAATTLALACASCAAPALDVAASGPVLPAATTTRPPAGALLASKKAPYKGPSSAPFSQPDSPHRILYDPSLASDPLPARHARLRVTAAEAVSRTPALPDVQPGRPRVTLRQLTYGWAGRSPTRRPGWVLTWHHSRAIVHGDVWTTEEQRREIRRNDDCVYVVVVDATTGGRPFEGQSCWRRGTPPQ